MNKPNLNFTAPINKVSYGITGLNLLRTLQNHYNVALFPIPSVQGIDCDSEYLPAVQTALNERQSFDYNAPSLRLWHQFDMAQHVGNGPRIGFPIFELDEFNEVEKHQLSSLDHIFVTSEWAQDIVEYTDESFSTDIIPLGFDPDVFFPVYGCEDEHYTIFLNIGKWEYRKGHDVLLEAFNNAFEPKDRVSLWMLCYNPFLEPQRNNGVDGNAEWKRLYKSSKMGHRIDILDRVNSQQDIAGIINMADCGVFPSRAEGWNLPLLEMMACGKPTICTKVSAHTEFTDEFINLFVDCYDTEVACDNKFFLGECGRWASFNDDSMYELVTWMRKIHEDKQNEGTAWCSEDRLATIERANQFTWANSAKKIVKALSNV
jgi:glycosyltransferase involved in cell wall biosynthesis